MAPRNSTYYEYHTVALPSDNISCICVFNSDSNPNILLTFFSATFERKSAGYGKISTERPTAAAKISSPPALDVSSRRVLYDRETTH